MKSYSYKGYKVVQYDDNDVEIKLHGRLVFHGQYTKELTEFELYKVVDDYIKMLSEDGDSAGGTLEQHRACWSKEEEQRNEKEIPNRNFDKECSLFGRYDEALAQYLMEQGVITEPCKVGDEVFFVELGQVKCGKYLAASKNHVIVTMHNLIQKPFEEQLKDMYDNRYVKIAILKNEDAFLSREDAERDLQNEH